ncbi:helix-turn-helix domain-containing protein [Sinorhizobium meliloti]|uniref:thermonuclease family protein n=2 Tax=Rhizobium meliloti TaxID=382 RepID=UPI000FDA1199|nr:thermonuclease family protein [Sinorhizobium meliloti]MDE3814260.1 thermonuclease family protein [Sinorhizobium meliloti]MDW9411404.1 helix-turn-helix domain-containing protein [Sinorhizobium meliloti]MDW9456704.1 helix-turn-helix domain-containing protein [Sinorhizobium meliloti]MDW9469683.1 helix-turn-helix domain-containing protein [Sinorhizobium meliloti]MDW9557515.1 helix-turn-helix domain-containing protein [Sinorhizobium meliloti]
MNSHRSIGVTLALLLFAHFAFAADPITGRATVIDGDTIEIRGERIRLHGVDAPESWQKCENADGSSYRCGREAAQELDRFLAESRPARCEFVQRDRYKRFVGVCFRADGRDVNHWLVESGNAVDWTRYSNGVYANDMRSIDREIGARLRSTRQVLGISQQIFAKKVGVSFQQIQKYEKGINRVSAGMLVKICQSKA